MCKKEEKMEEPEDKLTIVGGQPDRKDHHAFITNIEEVLLKAVEDEEFRDILFKDRKSAIEQSGIQLNKQDRMILESIHAPALTATLNNLMKSKLTSRRTFLKASAAGFGFLIGSFFGAYYGIPTIESKKYVKCCNNITEIKEALRLYSNDNITHSHRYKYEVYPFSLDALTKLNSSKHKPYLEKIPTCPIGNIPYIYEVKTLRGENCYFVENNLRYSNKYNNVKIHSTFLGQLFYMKEKKTSVIKVLLIIEQIFGIYFSIFWECNPPPTYFRLYCRNSNLHQAVSGWEALLFKPLMWPTYQLTGGIR